MPNTLEWFKERIGKRVYRDKLSCLCADCKDVEENGMLIDDEVTAENLYHHSCDLQFDYRDENKKK